MSHRPGQRVAGLEQPASLRSRSAAFALDYVLIAAYLGLLVALGLAVRLAAPDASSALFGSPIRGELTGFLLLTLPVTLYFAISEHSAAEGTWGKRRLGLRVVTRDGGRLGLGRSLLRSGLKFAPWELAHAAIWQFTFAGPRPPAALDVVLGAVWLLVGLNLLSALIDGRNRALYDLLAGTAVVQGRPPHAERT